MRLVFSPEASAEFRDGESYYERQVPGLGTRFRADVRDALRRMRHWVRRMILSRFPYKLLYAVETDHIYIIAVAHLHRAPDYWVERDRP